jgi:hypothetical protein
LNRRLAFLIGGTLGLWLLAAPLAGLRWGTAALVQSAVATVVCLVPASLTFWWTGWTMDRSPEQQLLGVLGGTLVRMGFVAGVGVLGYFSLTILREDSFWIWLIVFYLATLALEVVLLSKRPAARNP